MFDYKKIENEVTSYIEAGGVDTEDYDIEGLMDELRGCCIIDGDYEGPVRGIDDLDPDYLTDLLERYDKSVPTKLTCSFYVGDDSDRVTFLASEPWNEGLCREEAMAEIRFQRGAYIADRAEIEEIY